MAIELDGAGAAFLLIGPVQVFHLGQRGGLVDGGGQLVRQLSLLRDGIFDGLPPFHQPPQIAEAFFQVPQNGVVHGPVQFLAVTGDEWNGVASVQELDDVGDVLGVLAQFLGEGGDDWIHKAPFCAVRQGVSFRLANRASAARKVRRRKKMLKIREMTSEIG